MAVTIKEHDELLSDEVVAQFTPAPKGADELELTDADLEKLKENGGDK